MRMTTRIGLAIVALLAIGVAWQQRDLAAGYVAAIGYAIIFLLHTIEYKINKLLDNRGILVWDDEIAKD